MLKDTPEFVHRCVTLGTPHFGLAIGDYAVVAEWTGDQSRQMSQDAPFVLQGKSEMPDNWRNLDDVVRTLGLWTVPLSTDRFFRATFRW